jgi:leucyl-tRNA synthetase
MIVDKKLLTKARILRKKMTTAEKILWCALRRNNLNIKFKRQSPFEFGKYNYIADFYCPTKKLIVELDGGIHNDLEIREYDSYREEIFKEMGYEILRFSNNEVINNLNEVILKIKNIIK